MIWAKSETPIHCSFQGPSHRNRRKANQKERKPVEESGMEIDGGKQKTGKAIILKHRGGTPFNLSTQRYRQADLQV